MRWYNTDKNNDWLLFILLYYNLLERFYKLSLGTHNLCAWKHLRVQMRFHSLVKQNHNNPTVSCSFLLFKLIITGSTPPISVNLHRLKGNNNCETGLGVAAWNLDRVTLLLFQLYDTEDRYRLSCTAVVRHAVPLNFTSRACKAIAVWSHECNCYQMSGDVDSVYLSLLTGSSLFIYFEQLMLSLDGEYWVTFLVVSQAPILEDIHHR